MPGGYWAALFLRAVPGKGSAMTPRLIKNSSLALFCLVAGLRAGFGRGFYQMPNRGQRSINRCLGCGIAWGSPHSEISATIRTISARAGVSPLGAIVKPGANGDGAGALSTVAAGSGLNELLDGHESHDG